MDQDFALAGVQKASSTEKEKRIYPGEEAATEVLYVLFVLCLPEAEGVSQGFMCSGTPLHITSADSPAQLRP